MTGNTALATLTAVLPPGLVPLPQRLLTAHKGSFGRVAIVGGSRGMAGAVALAGMASLRTGSGLVTLGVPDRCADVVAGFNPCYMCRPLPDDSMGRLSAEGRDRVDELLSVADAVAIGPGLGQSSGVRQIVAHVYRRAARPLVIDADGLNALAQRREPLSGAAGPRILTPHPGEFARLTGRPGESREVQLELAERLAAEHGVVCVLKGHGTLVTDGQRRYINPTGNPGMATGGSGDVLTGILVALLGQGYAPWDAACLAVFAHGLAGDLAAERLGQMGLTARDLIDWLPAAFQQLH